MKERKEKQIRTYDKKENGKNATGRPNVFIDYDTVEKLASIMCTQEEIASYLNIGTRTLQMDEEALSRYWKGIDKGKMSIRRQQYKIVEEGNATMAIWLGKQYLNQKDKQEVEVKTTEINVDIEDLDE